MIALIIYCIFAYIFVITFRYCEKYKAQPGDGYTPLVLVFLAPLSLPFILGVITYSIWYIIDKSHESA